MKVMLVGKSHMSGTAKKTGKPYDFNIAHIVGRSNGVEGQSAEQIMLDPKTYPLDSLAVGKYYHLDRDGRGWVCGFEPA